MIENGKIKKKKETKHAFIAKLSNRRSSAAIVGWVEKRMPKQNLYETNNKGTHTFLSGDLEE